MTQAGLPPAGLKCAHLDNPLGIAPDRVRAGWERAGGRFTYRVEVPPNAVASVHVPSADPAGVRDVAGGHPAGVAEHPGLAGAGVAVFAVGPGRHEFSGSDSQASR